MKVNLSPDELNLLLSSLGLSLNYVSDPKARAELDALQTKLMEIRDAQQ